MTARHLGWRRTWFARGAVRELVVVLVLAGMTFQSATPALALAAKAFPVFGSFICHVSQPGQDPSIPGGEGSATSDNCCLLCQAAQLAKGALPPQALHIPARDAAAIPIPASLPVAVDRDPSLHKLPRAPPV